MRLIASIRPLCRTISSVFCSVLQCVAVSCSVLQSVAGCCGVLQCIASIRPQFAPYRLYVAACCSVLQCVAVCCSVLRCVHIENTGNTLQQTATHHDQRHGVFSLSSFTQCRALYYTATHCNTLQHTTTHSNTP